jgi:hypothetical protein
MANPINDDEIVETDHGTDDLDERTERSFPSLKCYNAVDGSI